MKHKATPKQLAVMVAVAVLAGLCLSFRPWQLVRDQTAKTGIAEQRRKQAESALTDLTRRKVQLGQSVGMEKRARDAGYRSPGEQPIEVKR